MKTIFKNRIFQFFLVLSAGLLIGWFLFGGNNSETHLHNNEVAEETIWTCSMHPQIRQNEPGKCPICGMDLIPLSNNNQGVQNNFTYSMSPEAAALANVRTKKVTYNIPEYEIALTGKVFPDERKLVSITADFSGRIEKLFVDFTGQTVQKDEKLGTIYSPELVSAQKELLEAAKNKESNPSIYSAVKEKLRLWKMTEKQISYIESAGEVFTELDIYADVSGIVTKRNISTGDYTNKGDILFEIADLSSVWIMLDAYESDLPWINLGSKVNFNVASLPGKEFSSTVTFVDPLINLQTRTASVRTETGNPGLLLKPGMFVNAILKSTSSNLTMPRDSGSKSLMIPKTSVLWTGKRSVVYVKTPRAESPTFEMREVILGPRASDNYIVEKGLTEGEEIVVNGVFAVDAAAQLSGKYSMMNQPESKRLEVNNTFKTQLTDVVNNYFLLKNAFVESDVDKVKKEAQKVNRSLKNVNMSLLENDPHHQWMEIENNLSSSLSSVLETNDIEEQRKHFEIISEALINAAELFGVNIDWVYVQYCPMAFDDKGAYWLSESEEIRNPYFGDMMLTCGEVTKKISAIDSYKTSEEKTNRQPEHQH